MRYNDHYKLSKYLADMFGIDNKLQRAVFIWGNVTPDFDKLSYLQGYGELRDRKVELGEKLSLNDRRKLLIAGHTAEGSRQYVNKISNILKSKAKWNLFDWYRFGKATHYVTDRFTYPHTIRYHEGFFAHVDYEDDLHEEFSEILDSIADDHRKIKRLVNRYLKVIPFNSLYRAYRRESPGVRNDCGYILGITVKYMGYILAF